MNRKQFLILFFFISLVSCDNKNPIKENTNTAKMDYAPIQGLINRLIPSKKDSFKFEMIQDTEKDVFELESENNLIIVRGNTSNSIAVGINFYLKEYCNTYISWYKNDPVELPNVLPKVNAPIRKTAKVHNRFFLNYCTFGYSMPWWQWNDWERLIDWMALNGVTMPLAITGQEAIWYEVWKEYGLDDEQIRNYFTGPTHLPWHRMSNLDKWGGPLPISWLNHQKDLQKKIVERERELGMTPVLPAFAGHVPKALKEMLPNAKINQLSSWGGFPDEYRSFFLDPLDPLFQEIQTKFLARQTELYGTNHIYGADPFNEVHPPSWEPDYLATVANIIYTSISKVDPEAIWLQMSWIFYFERDHWTNERIKAMITAVPKNKMVLLDYFCENQEVWKMTESFYGQPFIWNYLGNFGGNTMLAGNLDEVNNRLNNAFENAGQNFTGLGATLEAFDVNPLMYNHVFEKNWDIPSTSDTNQWMNKWADIRYGSTNKTFRKAWEILHNEIYTKHTALGQATLTNARPSLTGSGNWTTNPKIHYDNNVLLEVWELMLAEPSHKRKSYNYDIVNVGRQFLGNHFIKLRDDFTDAYHRKDLKELHFRKSKMLALMDDLDTLLATEDSFLLGKWINNARAMGITEEEKNYYEQNARNILTTWGGKAQSLNDYANRNWAGLTKGFYKKRWELFIDEIILAVEKGNEFDEKDFFNKVTHFEWDWTQSNDSYPTETKGEAVAISKELLDKYRPIENR